MGAKNYVVVKFNDLSNSHQIFISNDLSKFFTDLPANLLRCHFIGCNPNILWCSADHSFKVKPVEFLYVMKLIFD